MVYTSVFILNDWWKNATALKYKKKKLLDMYFTFLIVMMYPSAGGIHSDMRWLFNIETRWNFQKQWRWIASLKGALHRGRGGKDTERIFIHWRQPDFFSFLKASPPANACSSLYWNPITCTCTYIPCSWAAGCTSNAVSTCFSMRGRLLSKLHSLDCSGPVIGHEINIGIDRP